MRTLLSIVAALTLSGVVRAGEGTLIVLNKAESTASLIDLDTGKEVKRVETGAGPHEVAVSPDGRTAVVADYGQQEAGHTLSVIDIAAGTRSGTIELGSNTRPHGIAFLDDTHVLVTTEGSKSLVLVDLDKKQVAGTAVTGQETTHMVAIAPTLKRAFTANIGSGSVTAIDLESMKPIGNIETGTGAEGIDVSPNGAEVWVANREADTVTVIDAKSLEVVAQIPCATFPIRVKFTPNGRHVLVSNAQSGEVGVFDAKSRAEIARVKIEAKGGAEMLGSQGPVPIGIVIPRSGGMAYVAASNADIIAPIELGSWTLGDSLKAGKEPDGMAWSPITVGAEPEQRPAKTYGS